MNPIQAYMTRHGIDVQTFAKRAKRSQSAIYSYIQGTRRPLRKHLAQLSKATKNEVTVDELASFYGLNEAEVQA